MTYISEKVRLEVALRAGFRCEYCRILETDMFLSFEIDHIIAQKHGGGSELANLAFCCPHCNMHKGSDLVTIVAGYQDIVPLFNPRTDDWIAHFDTLSGEIIAKTKTAQATVKLLKLNSPDLLIIRRVLAEAGRYP